TVEDFHDWAVERGPFDGTEPVIPGITWAEDLEPYIERKLFTVNTGHAAADWHGWGAGHATIADALALLDAFCAALAFYHEGDEEVDRLQELLRTEPAHVVATEGTGLTPDDPAFAAVLKRITIHHPAT